MRFTSCWKDETSDLALRVFELSQTLCSQWLTADYDVKRKILEIILLNCKLVDVSLCPITRKPFDMLVQGQPVPQSGGNRTSIELFVDGLASWESRFKAMVEKWPK
jgi:hypothetical protein